jgi:hypothetical protein
MTMVECVGWVATAIFVGSYFSSRPGALRTMQMLGAMLWIVYGLMIKALPVIAANVLVFGAAAFTALRRPGARGSSAFDGGSGG